MTDTDTGEVVTYTNPLGEFGSVGPQAGQLRYPYDLALLDADTLAVCEYGNNRVQVFDRTGQALAVWGEPGRAIVDVQGVGYEVDAPMTTFYDLPAIGHEVTLYTHLAVREDAHTLYGFVRLSDRTLFRHLLKVNGVGARLALGILSGMDAGQFIACVQAGDATALVRLPGIGKKTAERLIIELRDRLESGQGGMSAASGESSAAAAATPVEDAVSALVGLGYKPQEASRMVRAIDSAELSSGEIIRRALQRTVQ